jgi:hypothetical protein
MGILNRDDGSVRYEGKVLGTGQRYVGFDYDVAYYATCWDDEKQGLVEFTYRMTYPQPMPHYEVTVDADEAVRMLAVEAQMADEVTRLRSQEWSEFCSEVVRAHTIRKGSRVRIVKGRKVPVGAEGTVVWSGDGNYGPRIGFIPDAYPEGGAVFTAESNAIAIDIDAPDWTATRRPDAEIENDALLALAARFGVSAGFAVSHHIANAA